MTAADLEAYFDLLTDKTGSPYFIQSEKSRFLNQAQIKYVNATIPSNEEGVVNVEMTSGVLSNIYTLVFETGNLNPNSSGEILKTAIQTALNTASGSTEPFMYVMDIAYNGFPCRFTRHNDWYEIENNSYKRGSTREPRYKQLATKFQVSPASASANVKFTLIKYPKNINLASSITSELPDQTHKTLVEIAVELAGIAMRDEAITQINPQ
jgi:hypothetical protein